MLSRISFSIVAAIAMLTSAPALAAQGNTRNQQCSCCSDGSIHETDHPAREAQLKKGSRERSAQPRTIEQTPDAVTTSWGG